MASKQHGNGQSQKPAKSDESRHLVRDVLPIHEHSAEHLTTYDAKDPDTNYPPIVPLRPPAGAPNVLVVLIDDVGFGASSAFGGPVATPTFERLAAGGLKYNRFHTTALCSPTRAALLLGSQPSHGRHGRDHRARDVGAGPELDAAEHLRAARRSAEAQRLLDGAVRQVPRSPGVGDESGSARSSSGRPAAAASSTSTDSSAARRISTIRRSTRARRRSSRRSTPEEGYHFTADLDRQGDEVGASAEVAHARQTVLHVLRARRDARAASRAEGMVGQVQGQVRSGLGHSCARRRSHGRRSSASFPRTASSRSGTRRSRRGTRSPPR